MAKDYRKLWAKVADVTEGTESTRILAEILTDEQGGTFVSQLGRRDAELCIEILDRVSRDPHPDSHDLTQLPGSVGTQTQQDREAGVPRYVVEVGRNLWTASQFRGYKGEASHFRRDTRLWRICRCQVRKVRRRSCRSEGRKGCSAGRLPEDKEGEDRQYFLGEDATPTILPQRFCKEVVLWRTFSHPNILRLVGVQGGMEEGSFVTVSEWMAHGNIMAYIRKNHTNRLELVCAFDFPITPSLNAIIVAWSISRSEISP